MSASYRRDDRELLDIADHQLRDELAGIEGLASAPVFGGVFRQVQIYVHPRSLESLKMSPMDVARVDTPEPGESDRRNTHRRAKLIRDLQQHGGSPKDFEKIPLFSDGRKIVKIVYLGDVAQVVDGSRWRTNTVHVEGKRAVYMPLLRQSGASAIRVVDRVKAFLPELHKAASSRMMSK